jgi:hypothetical protein
VLLADLVLVFALIAVFRAKPLLQFRGDLRLHRGGRKAGFEPANDVKPRVTG